MIENDLVIGTDDWRERIAELQKLLAAIKPQLIAAESELAERLAAISAFEFRLRVKLEPLSRRLDIIEDEIFELREEMRRQQFDLFFPHASQRAENWAWQDDLNFGASADAAASGDYRYRTAPTAPPPQSLTTDELSVLKQLYRQLARRFHPDFALDEDDRAYRTDLMMAINSAYAAGDLARLEEIAQRPDQTAQAQYSGVQLAEALLQELTHCQRRLTELEDELAQLAQHRSTRLMRREEKEAALGRDLFDELASNLHELIANRMVQRDVLAAELEALRADEPQFSDDSLAETIYDLGLEQMLDEDKEAAVDEWLNKHQQHINLDDEPEDDEWLDGLRRGRGKV